uniref:Uncharacterized protein n=1 Tax=Leersia perrieri TaxID=77586 RepID=A0A0D9XB79_9ORYZ
MAVVAKTRASFFSCFTFLKEALILPTHNPKLFTPILLLTAFSTFLILATNVAIVQPLGMDVAQLAIKLQNTDPSSAEYRRILEEMKHDVTRIVAIVIPVVLVSLVLGFLKECVAFFAASSTYSGDRYSLPELISKVIRGNLKGPLITMVSGCNSGHMDDVPGRQQQQLNLLFQALLFVIGFLAFLYFNVVGMVSIVVSVADTECRGIRALRQAWRLMTGVRRKEGLVLVIVVYLLSMAISPLNLVAAAYTKKSMALGLCFLAVYCLLSGAEQLFYIAAATVYCVQAMDSKEEAMPCAYDKIPTGCPVSLYNREMVEHDMTPVFVYGGAATLGSVVLGFVKPCLAFFAASSTFAGNRYSLLELHRKAMKGNLKGPLITIAMVTLLQFMVYMGKLPYDVMQRHFKVFSVPRPLLFLCYLASNYLSVVGMVSVGVSVSDKKKNCRGIHALRKAWLLMTRVRRNQGIVLAVVVFLLPKAIDALNLVGVAETKSMALGICLFAVYALLSAGEQLFCFAATTVYCFGASSEAPEGGAPR